MWYTNLKVNRLPVLYCTKTKPVVRAAFLLPIDINYQEKVRPKCDGKASGFLHQAGLQRLYAGQLPERQGKDSADILTKMSSSHAAFQVLTQTVLEQARWKDSGIMFVDTAYDDPEGSFSS